MKIKAFTIIAAAAVFMACTPPVSKDFRIIHNNDGTDMLANLWFGSRPLTLDDVNAAVDMVAGTQVTTYMMCTGSSATYYRSAISNMLGDDRGGALVNAYDSATYAIYKRYWDNAIALESQGTDMISASLKRAKSHGLETFITIRLNDLHFADTTNACKMAMEDFWLKNPQYWTNDASIGYNSSGAYDYSHPEVRSHKLSLIQEQIGLYGGLIDGVDLDFMRFIVYFKADSARANMPLMTDFVKKVREMVDSASHSLGRPLLLSARVAPSVAENEAHGLDIKEWLKLGLLDFVSIGTHWRGDPAMPVGQFRKDLGDLLNVPLYGSIDDGGFRSSAPGASREFWTHGALRGMASYILSQGADGLYLFNYYFGRYYEKQHKAEEGEQSTPQYDRVICPQMLQELGSIETLRRRNKVYALSDGHNQYGIKPNTPLPIKLSSNHTKSDILSSSASCSMYIGDDPIADKARRAVIFVRKTKGECAVSCNGELLTATCPEDVSRYSKDLYLGDNEEVLALEIPVRCLRKGDNEFLFQLSPKCSGVNVVRMELLLDYGPVETNGYF